MVARSRTLKLLEPPFDYDGLPLSPLHRHPCEFVELCFICGSLTDNERSLPALRLERLTRQRLRAVMKAKYNAAPFESSLLPGELELMLDGFGGALRYETHELSLNHLSSDSVAVRTILNRISPLTGGHDHRALSDQAKRMRYALQKSEREALPDALGKKPFGGDLMEYLRMAALREYHRQEQDILEFLYDQERDAKRMGVPMEIDPLRLGMLTVAQHTPGRGLYRPA